MSFKQRVETIVLEELEDYVESLTTTERKIIASEVARKVGTPEYVKHLERRIAHQRHEFAKLGGYTNSYAAGYRACQDDWQQELFRFMSWAGCLMLILLVIGLLALAFEGKGTKTVGFVTGMPFSSTSQKISGPFV